MKLYTARQLAQADRHTIESGVPSLDLMEKAAASVADEMIEYPPGIVHIFCGTGNNGGDGMALARILDDDDWEVNVYLVHFSKSISKDLLVNYERLDFTDVSVQHIYSDDDFPEFEDGDLVVDAIFGIGLNRPVKGLPKQLIDYINAAEMPVLSIDIPSGMYADRPNASEDSVIIAENVVTFTRPKISFLLPGSRRYMKNFVTHLIGIDEEYLNTLPTPYYFTFIDDMAGMYQIREKFAHKGDFGHSLMIAGSYGKAGAAVLSTRAALNTGAGLVTAYVPKSAYNILQISVPEVMVEVDEEDKIVHFNYRSRATVIGIGPGLGAHEDTVAGMEKFLKKNTLPLVLDADALNILAMRPDLLEYLPEDTVLTPHEGELKRLIGEWENDFDKLDKASAFSGKHRCVLVIKGKYSVVVYRGEFHFNTSGNSAMASGGMGDVLTGVITALRAQGYNAFEAAMLGVFIHGAAADKNLIVREKARITASNIIETIPEILYDLREKSLQPEEEEEYDDDFFDFPDDFDPLDDDDLPY